MPNRQAEIDSLRAENDRLASLATDAEARIAVLQRDLTSTHAELASTQADLSQACDEVAAAQAEPIEPEPSPEPQPPAEEAQPPQQPRDEPPSDPDFRSLSALDKIKLGLPSRTPIKQRRGSS